METKGFLHDPMINPLDIIRNSNYSELAKLIIQPEFIVTKEYLLTALSLSDSGILLTLLMHPSADPNPVILEALNKNDDMITALLENPRMKFYKCKDVTMIGACEKNKVNIVKILLKDARFFPGNNTYEYILRCIHSGSVNVLRLLSEDSRFNFAWIDKKLNKSYCQSLYDACYKENLEMVNIILSNPEVKKIKIHPDILSYIIVLNNKNIFSAVLGSENVSVTKSIVEECMEPNKSQLFLVLICKLKPDYVDIVFNMCLEKQYCGRIEDFIQLGKKQISMQSLVKCAEENLSISAKYLTEGLLNKNMSPCVSKDAYFPETCCIKIALEKSYDKTAYAIIGGIIPNTIHFDKRSDKFNQSCKHSTDLLRLAINKLCYDTAKVLLTLVKSIPDDILERILLTCPDDVIESLISVQRQIPEYIILKCLEKKRISAVRIACKYHEPDIRWNNYIILRTAAEDFSNASFDALYQTNDSIKYE